MKNEFEFSAFSLLTEMFLNDGKFVLPERDPRDEIVFRYVYGHKIRIPKVFKYRMTSYGFYHFEMCQHEDDTASMVMFHSKSFVEAVQRIEFMLLFIFLPEFFDEVHDDYLLSDWNIDLLNQLEQHTEKMNNNRKE